MTQIIVGVFIIIAYGAFMTLVGFGLGRFERNEQIAANRKNDGRLALRDTDNAISEDNGTGAE